MPVYDLICPNSHKQLDRYLKLGERPPCPECGEPTQTCWDSPPSVIGDEIDVVIRHGICNSDGSPRRYRSRTEYNRVAKERGLTNVVRHMPKRGSDKSPHTTRWV